MLVPTGKRNEVAIWLSYIVFLAIAITNMITWIVLIETLSGKNGQNSRTREEKANYLLELYIINLVTLSLLDMVTLIFLCSTCCSACRASKNDRYTLPAFSIYLVCVSLMQPLGLLLSPITGLFSTILIIVGIVFFMIRMYIIINDEGSYSYSDDSKQEL